MTDCNWFYFPCFRYAPQDTISTHPTGDGTNLYVIAGDVANNTYTWYQIEDLDTTIIETITADSLFTPPANGIYYCEVTNSMMTDPSEPYHNLVLISESFDFQSAASIACANSLETDSLALVALYNATGGDDWNNNSNWLIGNVSSWYGITLTIDGCRVKELSLYNNSLNGIIPPEIGNLTSLIKLPLSFNQITTIPTEIGNLNNLIELNLKSNQITTIPPGIENLNSLTKLYLNNNQIHSIPPEIGNLNNLTRLDLYDNQIHTIPPEIENLNNLTRLDLHNNQITTIPPEIGNLNNLIELYFGTNQITIIPPEIENLNNLVKLNLSYNQITTLPPEIGNLNNLTDLYLMNNQITTLPPEIGNLNSLTQLALSNNQITTLPPEIGNLSSLTNITLNNNQLSSSIPIEFGQLTNLTFLNLSDNQLNFNDLFNTYNILIQTYIRHAPQDTISTYPTGDGTNLYVIAGDVANNTYTWYQIEDLDTTIIETMIADSLFTPPTNGIYYCEVTNSIMTDPSDPYHNLVLTSEPFTFQTSAGIQLELKAYLQGPYDASSDSMTNILQATELPNGQPYILAPWNYLGTESVSTFETIGNVVDWVLVELLNQDTILVAQQAALLKTDGTVVDVTGSSILNFEGVPANENYYVLLRHRNHLDIVSNVAHDLSTPFFLDFTNNDNVMQGNDGNNQLTEVALGVYAMRAGDFDGNGVFNTMDYNSWLNVSPQATDYALEDCNLDTYVFIQDYVLFSSNFSTIGVEMIRY